MPPTRRRLLAVALAASVVLATLGTIYVASLLPPASDRDGDGCANDWEILNGLNPDDPTDVFQDPDGDGLTSGVECDLGTAPLNPDTDADRLLDGEEVMGFETLQGTFTTDPLDPDTDGDTALDGDEVLNYHRFDRVETEDFYAGVNATARVTSVAQVVDLAAGASSLSQIRLAANVPWEGEYKITVSGTGAATFQGLRLNASTFGVEDLASELIANAPTVTVRRNLTGTTPLIPLEEERGWIHLYTDSLGTEEGLRPDQVEFSAQVSTFWQYTGEFRFEATGEFELVLRIEIPPDASRIDPGLRPYLTFLSSLEIETSFFRVFRKTIDPLDPDVDGDTLPDGVENSRGMYPLNTDPDEDGISDPSEMDLGTDDERRDTDGDGVRDGVEVGRSGGAADPLTPWDTDPANVDGDAGATTTDPTRADTDGDGLPDGFLDGWSFEEARGWGAFGTRDGIRQAWEGEDFDRDGVVDSGAWNLGLGPGETDPNTPDTDGDQLPDAWEVQYALDPLDATGDQGAGGNPDGDHTLREHSLRRDTTTGVSWPYGRGQSFEASESTYEELVLWIENRPTNPFTENLEVLVIGMRNGLPDPSVYSQSVAVLTVPVATGELRIPLNPHSLTVGDPYTLWFRQASTTSTGVLDLGWSGAGEETTGISWSEVSGIFEPIGDGAGDLYFLLRKGGGANQLSNLGEYIVGTDPRDPDTDRDGAGDWPEAQVALRTNVPRGGKSIERYGSLADAGDYEWIWFDQAEFGFEERLENPPVGHEAASADNILIALLQTGRSGAGGAASLVVNPQGTRLFVWEAAAETTWYRNFFLWERTGPTFQWSTFLDANENGVIDATVYVYALGVSQGQANTSPVPELLFRDQEIYLSDPFDARTDWDRFPDRQEPLWFLDVDGDGLANARDTDSDGDGLGDDNEARFIWRWPDLVPLNDVDGDGLDNIVDPDSDGDGTPDGLEYVFFMDFDWDAYKNMVDNDTDNDGLPDGWMDGYRYDPGTGTFLYDPIYDDGVVQVWEGEDTNRNGLFEPSLGETNATHPDSDGDGLWDGFSLDVPVGRYAGFHEGELTMGTDPHNPDTDGDGIPDGTEVHGWLRLSASPPALVTSDPLSVHTDADGLDDFLEYSSMLTDPANPDTDFDGLGDGVEDANQNGLVDPGETLPYRIDSDADGLWDGLELGVVGDANSSSQTDPLNRDTDGDGLADGLEDGNGNGDVEANEPDPNDPDSDDDGIVDGIEFRFLGNGDRDGDMVPNLRDTDSDGDGIGDGDDLWHWNNATQAWEPAWYIDFDDDGWPNALDTDSDGDNSTDGVEDGNKNGMWEPALSETNPLDGDEDSDGLRDGIESGYGLNRSDPDTDGDGILDGYEQGWNLNSDGEGGVNANDTDSDNDGLDDAAEDKDRDGIFEPFGGANETDPTTNDTDSDGLSDFAEGLYGADPRVPDTDGDGLLDGPEIFDYGTNATTPYTDGDDLSDGEEVRGDFGPPTDPTKADTDEDGLRDDEEIRLGYNATNPDMDGDGLIDGVDLQPLAHWADLYRAPEEARHTYTFRGSAFENLLEWGYARDNGTRELAQIMDQAPMVSPPMPVQEFLGPIGTDVQTLELFPYLEAGDQIYDSTTGRLVRPAVDQLVLPAVGEILEGSGYQVKTTPASWTQHPETYAGHHGTLPFIRSNYSITIDNYEPVPAPGGFFHRILEWDLTPGATNVISIQFGLAPAYDESFETNTSLKLPGMAVRVYDYGWTYLEELFATVFLAMPLGDHFYQVDLVIPPDIASGLRWPDSNRFVFDLTPAWITRQVDAPLTLAPLLPYRYGEANIEFIEVESSSHGAAWSGGPGAWMTEGFTEPLPLPLGLRWEDLLRAGMVLTFLSRTFADLVADETLLEEVTTQAPTLDWPLIREAAGRLLDEGLVPEDLLDLLLGAGRHTLEGLVTRATLRGWAPFPILTVAAITTRARFHTHTVLSKEYIDLANATALFDTLSLDLVTGASGEYTVNMNSLFFYNTRTATAVDHELLINLALTGLGVDILVLAANSSREVAEIMDSLDWSGLWSAVVEDFNQTDTYQGNLAERAVEVYGGVRQLKPFVSRPGRTVFANGSFYYDPGEIYAATGNATALPGGTAPEEFLFDPLPPLSEVWVMRNVSTPEATAYESSEIRLLATGESAGSVAEASGLKFTEFQYERFLKRVKVIDEALPRGADRAKLRGFKIGLGISAALVVWDGSRDAVVAYQSGDDLYLAIIILDSVQSLADITFTFAQIQKLAPIARGVRAAGIVVQALFVGYFLYKASQATTELEREYYVSQAAVWAVETVLLYTVPYYWVIFLTVFVITTVVSFFGLEPGPTGPVGLVLAVIYRLFGCRTPEERAEEIEEIQGQLEEITDWLRDRFAAHAEAGELALFAGEISLVSEAQALAEDAC